MSELEKVLPELFVFGYNHLATNEKKAMFESDVQICIHNAPFEVIQDPYTPRIRPITIFNMRVQFWVTFDGEHGGSYDARLFLIDRIRESGQGIRDCITFTMNVRYVILVLGHVLHPASLTL